MEELQLLLETLATPLATTHGKAITLALLLALPFVGLLIAKSIWLTALTVALAATPAWILATQHVGESLALWLGVTWQAMIMLCALALMRATQRQRAMTLMSRIDHIDTRVETFLDALDRRAALVQELTRTEPEPLAPPRAATTPAEREAVE